MNELPEKAAKLLALALNSAAAEGEWRSASVKFVDELRRNGISFDYFQPPPEPRRNPFKMPFGKFKHMPIHAVPDDYLLWMVETMKMREPLKSHVHAEITARNL